jgi:hypothetical protein
LGGLRFVHRSFQFRPFFFAPPVAEREFGLGLIGGFGGRVGGTPTLLEGMALHEGDGGADLDAFAVFLGGEDAGVGFAIGGFLAGFVFVAVEAVDGDGVEDFHEALAHAGVGEAVEPGVVGNETDDAFGFGARRAGLGIVRLRDALGDAALRHAEEADVEVVESLALRLGRFLGFAVGGAEVAFLVDGKSGVAVVRRIADDDEDLLLLFHVVGGVAFFGELGEGQVFGRFDGDPAGEGVGEEDAGAFVLFVIQLGSPAGEHEIDLEVGDDVGRGQ